MTWNDRQHRPGRWSDNPYSRRWDVNVDPPEDRDRDEDEEPEED
jgi:hypothetical protein